MASSSLADMIIGGGDTEGVKTSPFVLEQAPERIMSLHPAIYRYRDELYYEHTIIRPGDIDILLRLLDQIDAKLTRPQALWVYNRIYEMARDLSERYVIVSVDLVWDRETTKLININEFGTMATLSDRTSKRLRR